MTLLAVPILYVILKYAAYVGWCYLGLKRFCPSSDDRLSVAFRLGFYRLLIGVVFGGAIGFGLGAAASALTHGGSHVFVYFCVYFPIRWVEWTIMSVMIIRESYYPNRWPIGLSEGDSLWRLGGIGVSFLADVPVIVAMGGFSVGRILC
jgi:hypothetical protein